ncbi:hypothetical protein G6F65_021901 [Rhizopus arrhizus]|nr:hypothetical protein G6F65_021901 [Rhizopus arrhizus]
MSQIDGVLAFVVGRAAAVPAVALDLQAPGIAAPFPFGGVATHDVAMAIHQHGRQAGLFDTARDQDGQVDPGGIRVDLTGKAQCRQQRDQVFVQVGMLRGRLFRHFAFRRVGDATRQRGQQGAGIKGFNGMEDGLFANHIGSRVRKGSTKLLRFTPCHN